MKTNTDFVIKKLKNFNLPILRGNPRLDQMRVIKKELDEIKKSIADFEKINQL